jgi:heterodisulfide reductase subunit A
MIQCVGCRNEDRNYCSRVCCGHSVKNALKLKAINPEMDVTIAFRDMRTYGFNEAYYRQASEVGVHFIRWTPEDPPTVAAAEAEDGRPILQVAAVDPILGEKLAFDADLLALAAAVIPSQGAQEIASLFKVPLGPDGFFQEAHVKLRPVEFAADGVFLCGMAHYPKHIPEAVNQAYGAAGRALALLSNDIVTVSGAVCEVNAKACMGCGACVAVCSYDAIELRKTKLGQKALVNPVICKGDGLCNAVCPTGAIVLKHFTDKEILSQIDALVPESVDAQ